jgi:cytochrome P450
VFGDRHPLEVLGSALWTLTEFATELAEYRERQPGDDLMTALVAAEVDGDRLTHAEIAAFLVLLSVAGNDTTRHTTSQAMRALTLNRDQRKVPLDGLDARLPRRRGGIATVTGTSASGVAGRTPACASLARSQLQAIFGELLRVLPDIEAGEPQLLRSAFIHGVKRMPCTFTARA